ncbi:MAG: dUTP diphosphatase [Erysipelotrichaceae bacterium]
MRFTITQLRELQGELDARIFKQHDTDRNRTRIDRCLALSVEIGELANETRCFKYWSVRPASAREVLLEELEDSIHFLLSLGIDLEDKSDFIEGENDEKPLSETFLDFYHATSRLTFEFTLENYLTCFKFVAVLAEKLEFSESDLVEFYLKKNMKNHQRQDTHY